MVKFYVHISPIFSCWVTFDERLAIYQCFYYIPLSLKISPQNFACQRQLSSGNVSLSRVKILCYTVLYHYSIYKYIRIRSYNYRVDDMVLV